VRPAAPEGATPGVARVDAPIAFAPTLDGCQPEMLPPGRETKRLIRRMRWRNRAPRRIVMLALVAAAAAVAWFHPSLRGRTRSAWQHLGGEVHAVMGRATAPRTQTPPANVRPPGG
jgi:hypothetical protein